MLLVAASCAKEEILPESTPHTLLVYVGTDNNLSGLEQAKLQAIRDGWTGKAADRIIAYIDKGRGVDARLIEISPEQVAPPPDPICQM